MDKKVFKQIEAVLYKYKYSAAFIKNLESELELIKNTFNECKAIEYSDMPGNKNCCSNTVENEVIERDKEIKKLENLLRREKALKEQVDNILNKLDDIEKKIVELKYFNKETVTWKQIAKQCGFSESHCRQKIRAEIIKKMAMGLVHKL